MAEALLERDAQLEVLVGAVAAGAAGAAARPRSSRARRASARRASCARSPSACGDEARVLDGARATTSSRRARSGRCATRRPAPTARWPPRWPTAARSTASSPRCCEELAAERPTVLVVEDVHWADDATLDVLGYAARRVEPVGARPRADATATTSSIRAIPLHRLLGALTGLPGAPHRARRRCRRGAVAGAGGAARGRDAAALHALTRRQPVLRHRDARRAAATACRPASRTRCSPGCGRLDPACREALEQLSVVPVARRARSGRVSCSARRFDALTRGRARRACVEVRPDGLGFRHELARRADRAAACPRCAGARCTRPCVAALRRRGAARARRGWSTTPSRPATSRPSSPYGPAAGARGRRAPARTARRSPTSRRCVPLRGAAARRERAAVLDDYGWELYNAAPLPRGGRARAARRSRCYARPRRAGRARAVPGARVAAPVHGRRDRRAPRTAPQRAVRILEAARRRRARWPRPRSTRARSSPWPSDPERGGAVLAPRRRARAAASQRMRPRRAVPELPRHRARGARRSRAGCETCATASRSPSPGGHHEAAARGYTNLGELLLRAGRLDELERCVADGLAFTRERGFWSHAYNLEVHRCLLLLRRGDWDGAERGLRGLVDDRRRPGHALRLQRAVARAAARAPRRPGGRARCSPRPGSRPSAIGLLLGLAYAGIARVEWAWLAGEPDVAERVRRAVLLARTEHPGAAPFRGELLRYLARAGLPAEPFDGCPAGWAAGLRGDWRGGGRGVAARSATPTRPRSELAESGDAEADRRGAAHARGPAAPRPPRRACASACARWARASRAARAR